MLDFRLSALILAAGTLLGQDTRLSYEAASVKLNTSGANGSSSNGSKGQIVITNMPLHRIIERAYGVKPFQVTGPGWLDDVRFDIAAKYPPDIKSEDRLIMMRNLLEDRFKMVVHRESKDMPGYALVVAKGHFKLKTVEPGGSKDWGTSQHGGRVSTLAAQKTSMATLADNLGRTLGEVVVDKTGLTYVYDFELKWTNDDKAPEGEAVPNLFTAVQETLGLKLQPQKVPVQIIVVDRIERTPIEQ
jgi:uncharacterized protein (TIGR03435 family)